MCESAKAGPATETITGGGGKPRIQAGKASEMPAEPTRKTGRQPKRPVQQTTALTLDVWILLALKAASDHKVAGSGSMGNSVDSRKVILLFGAVAFVASALVPPWTYTFDHAGTHSRKSAAYHFLLNPPKPEDDLPAWGVQLDIPRLGLEWAAIGGCCAIGFILTGSLIRKAQSVAGEDRLLPEPTLTPADWSQPKQHRSLTQEQIERLSTAVSEGVKSKFVAERQSQADRIVQQAVLAKARKHLQTTGDLAGFQASQVVQQEILRYAAEYT